MGGDGMRAKAVLAGLALAAGSLLGGCGGEGAEAREGDPAKPAAAEAAWSPARIGINRWAGYAALEMAAEAELFTDDQALVLPMGSTREAMAKFEAGHLDAIGATFEEALWLAGRGKRYRIAMVLDVSEGGDALLSRPGVGLAMLRGKRVGVERFGPGERLLEEALGLVGMSGRDVRKEHIAADRLAESLRGGEVDAVAAFEPALSSLEKEGFERIYDSAQLKGRIADALLVSEEAAADPGKRAGICAALRGHLAKSESARRDRKAAAREIAKIREARAQDYERAWEGLRALTWKESEAALRDPEGARSWAEQAASAMERLPGWAGKAIPEEAFGGIGCEMGEKVAVDPGQGGAERIRGEG